MGVIANPTETCAAIFGGVCVPFHAVFVCGRITEMESYAVILLGISCFIFIVGRRFEMLTKRWWLQAGTLFREGVSIVVILPFTPRALREHSDNVCLNGSYRTTKVSVTAYNLIVFHDRGIHEVLIIGDRTFFKRINLISDPLCPCFRLQNIGIRVQCVLNTFIGKEGASLCCSENEEVNQFTVR